MPKDLAKRIADLKERRVETIARVREPHTEDDDPGGWAAMRAAEGHADVLAIDAEIRELRARQAAREEE